MTRWYHRYDPCTFATWLVYTCDTTRQNDVLSQRYAFSSATEFTTQPAHASVTLSLTHTNTHTHIYVCVCVCMCACPVLTRSCSGRTWKHASFPKETCQTWNVSNTSKTSMDFGGECVLYFRHFQCLYDLFVCVCAHTRCLFLHTLFVCVHTIVFARACVRTYVCESVCVRMCSCVCACVRMSVYAVHGSRARLLHNTRNFHVYFNDF